MPEGPTIIAFKDEIQRFSQKIVTKSNGYANPFADELLGEKLLVVKTYGKYLILVFQQFFITVHFGMYGSFLINRTKNINPCFNLFFDKEFINFYVVRIKKIDGKPENYADDELDVFSPTFNPEKQKSMLIKEAKNQKIGDVLMNQAIFPGVGNIIRNEVLFYTKIHPESVVNAIPDGKIDELISKIQSFSRTSVEMIKKGIWHANCVVYEKEKNGNNPINRYVSPKIKRNTFVDEKVQRLYENQLNIPF